MQIDPLSCLNIFFYFYSIPKEYFLRFNFLRAATFFIFFSRKIAWLLYKKDTHCELRVFHKSSRFFTGEKAEEVHYIGAQPLMTNCFIKEPCIHYRSFVGFVRSLKRKYLMLLLNIINLLIQHMIRLSLSDFPGVDGFPIWYMLQHVIIHICFTCWNILFRCVAP